MVAGDPILEDFCSYLSDFPQLVRWNGFDAEDLDTFEKTGPKDPSRLRRLRSHYWDCMTDLCREGDYVPTAQRSDDWDFNPSDAGIIGNLGAGWWGSSRIALKWVVGAKSVREIREFMKDPDAIAQRGRNACDALVDALRQTGMQDLTVTFRARYRFQAHSQQDGTGEEDWPEEHVGTDDRPVVECVGALQGRWTEELAQLGCFFARCGEEVSAETALAVKRAEARRMNDRADVNEISLRTKHQRWRLYPVLDVFIWISPRDLCFGAAGLATRDAQVQRLRDCTTALLGFARRVCQPIEDSITARP